MLLLDHEPLSLSAAFCPDTAGYLGYMEIENHEAAQQHVNREAIAWQPYVLLYNQPRHCDNARILERFLTLEQGFQERYGEYERNTPQRPIRDRHWRHVTSPFRTLRAPHHYEFAPTRKLLIEGDTYCLSDVLNDAGYRRTLDGTEETQQIVAFSAMDPATPIGFFIFHRKIARKEASIQLYLYPNFIYVAPPYRGLGYGISLVSALLEIWEAELHHQASKYRGRCRLEVQIDADALTQPSGRPILELLRQHTLAAMASCAEYWPCQMAPLKVATVEHAWNEAP